MSGLFGNTRQAYYDKQKAKAVTMIREDVILRMVNDIRKDMPRLGARKLLVMMDDDLKSMGIHIGRDAFISLLAENNLLIKRKRSATRTTDSNHRFRMYPNLIKGVNFTRPNQVWVSDITYIRVGRGFVYLFLITDAYSHKIVGWDLSYDLSADNAVRALKMALKGMPNNLEYKLTHHSDRGTQYCCNEYVKLLNKKKITISMTENGDPLENAIAERVNGILKTEWINEEHFDSFKSACKFISRIIGLYNSVRPHQSISYLTPEVVHAGNMEPKRMWRNYWNTSPQQAVNL